MKQIYALLILVLISCQNYSKIEDQTTSVPAKDTIQQQSTGSNNIRAKSKKADSYSRYSIMDADSLQFNSIGFETDVDELIQKMGQPDSILDPAKECGYFDAESVPLKIYYYSAISFRVYNGKAEMNVINFSGSDIQLNYSGLTLDSHTSLKNIQTRFPASYAEADTTKEGPNNKEYIFVRLLPKAQVDDLIVLKFFQGKLIEFSLWIPC